jgi:hypothetical protein
LRDESAAYVVLTGGCPYEDSFEVCWQRNFIGTPSTYLRISTRLDYLL